MHVRLFLGTHMFVLRTQPAGLHREQPVREACDWPGLLPYPGLGIYGSPRTVGAGSGAPHVTDALDNR